MHMIALTLELWCTRTILQVTCNALPPCLSCYESYKWQPIRTLRIARANLFHQTERIFAARKANREERFRWFAIDVVTEKSSLWRGERSGLFKANGMWSAVEKMTTTNGICYFSFSYRCLWEPKPTWMIDKLRRRPKTMGARFNERLSCFYPSF